jgi:small-conductance mechanosensitive channel
MLVLAPWGESADLLSSLRAAFFGFRVGDVTISLSTVAFSLVFFLVGLGATRAIQRWLEVQYLPATSSTSACAIRSRPASAISVLASRRRWPFRNWA